MARLNKGITGGFSGRIGPVVGANWNGINVMRSRPDIRKSKTSNAQNEQRARFSLVTQFLLPMKELTMDTFRDYAGKMTGYNNAISYTMKNAVCGVYPDLYIDYSLVWLAKGTLPNVLSPSVVAVGDNQIRFDWKDNTGIGIARAEDTAILVAYIPESKQYNYSVKAGYREDGSCTLQFPGLKNQEVHTWIAFESVNKKDVSPGVYVGEVVVE